VHAGLRIKAPGRCCRCRVIGVGVYGQQHLVAVKASPPYSCVDLWPSYLAKLGPDDICRRIQTGVLPCIVRAPGSQLFFGEQSVRLFAASLTQVPRRGLARGNLVPQAVDDAGVHLAIWQQLPCWGQSQLSD
jgi:hypothetical protein